MDSNIKVISFNIFNACLIGKLGNKAGEWVFVDTGLENSCRIQSIEKQFGKDSRPQAIILTHPKGDSNVDEGMVAKMSPTFSHTSIDLGFRGSSSRLMELYPT